MKTIHIKLSDELFDHLIIVSKQHQLVPSAYARMILATHTGFKVSTAQSQKDTLLDDLGLEDIVFDEDQS